MMRYLAAAAAATALVFAATAPMAQEGKAPAKAPAKAAAVKVGPGQKVCNYKFPDGEKRSWVCKKEEPCCAWDAIKYVKCGSTITNCL